MTQAEGEQAKAQVIDPLNDAIATHIRRGAADGWVLVDAFVGDFARRGWCASDPKDVGALALPDWNAASGQWETWSPRIWDPYRQRARLFRTPNDAALTQQAGDPRRMLGSFSGLFEGRLSRQQEALLGAMSGSFHPTFEAHVIMGWALSDKLMETGLRD